MRALGFSSRFRRSIYSLQSVSIGQPVPGHGRELDRRHGGGNREQVPAPDVDDVVLIGEQPDRQHTADDSSEAGRFEAVGEEAFVDFDFSLFSIDKTQKFTNIVLQEV